MGKFWRRVTGLHLLERAHGIRESLRARWKLTSLLAEIKPLSEIARYTQVRRRDYFRSAGQRGTGQIRHHSAFNSVPNRYIRPTFTTSPGTSSCISSAYHDIESSTKGIQSKPTLLGLVVVAMSAKTTTTISRQVAATQNHSEADAERHCFASSHLTVYSPLQSQSCVL